MFEVGTVGTEEGFWGATGSLGNLARAASISSLLIIAFVAALTCLGAIVQIIYLSLHSITASSRSGQVAGAGGSRLEEVSSEVFAGFPQTGKEFEEVSQSQRITQIRNTDFPATPSAPGAAKCTLTKRPWSCLGK